MRRTAAGQATHRVVVFMKVIDTIAAVSTPRGKGGIAVIRISGADAIPLLRRVFLPVGAAPWEAPRRACFGKIADAEGNVLDEGLATYFAAPASFTGEDVVEISCHGGVLLTSTVLGAVLAAGARTAEAGEFTARAVLHGKMALPEAEALGALLDADTKGRLALARGGMEGRLSREIGAIYERLSLLLSDIYARVDFPEEELAGMSVSELHDALVQVRAQVTRLLATWQTGRAVSEGIETVICGPVNAGKSTLYNAIVGHDAAIVTDVAGTTRDILSETVSLGNVTLRLSDTAGLRETDDAVERIGVARADAAIDRAELVLAVFDGSAAPDDGVRALLSRLRRVAGTVVVVLNKQDKSAVFPRDLLKDFSHVVELSAATGEIFALQQKVEMLFDLSLVDLRHDAIVANARQYAALSKADEGLLRAIAALEADIPLDASCVEVELAMGAVGEVDGRAVGEDIVADIFSHFCVGK